MRVSPCAWAFPVEEGKSLEEQAIKVRELARESAQVTHNHPEGIKGAEATADAIFMCRYYNSKNEDINVYKQYIKSHIQNKYGYDLSKTLDDIRPNYCFNETCQNTVPQAIIAFLESTDFEDAVRNAISLGGDSDTLAAITGGIAEAAYGIPEEIREKAFSYLDEHLMGVLEEWEKFINKN